MMLSDSQNTNLLKFETETSYRKNTLVDFSVLFDTDIGCCLYLYKQAKRKFFEPYIYTATYSYIRYMVLSRKEKNPIRFMFKKEYKKNADSIYNQLLEKQWDKVISFSPQTNILKLIFNLQINNLSNLSINCRNEEESKKIKSFSQINWNVVINETDYKDYFIIYAHDMEEQITRDIKGKVVNLYGYARNHTSKDLSLEALSEYCILFANVTQFTLIPPFSDFIIPEG